MADGELLPQNIEAEQGVLGAILLDGGEGETVDNVMEIIRPEHMFGPKHRVIYEAMIDLYGRNELIDNLTVVDCLTKKGKLDDAEGPMYVSSLSDYASGTRRASRHAEMVKEAAQRREAIRFGQSIQEAARDETRPINETIEKGLRALSDSFPPSRGGIGKETKFKPVSASELLSVPPEENKWVWEPFIPEGGLVVLAGFAKTGKSTFAYPLAVAVSKGRPFLNYQTTRGAVLILAVEEHRRDVRSRLERFGMQSDDPITVHVGELDGSSGDLNGIRNYILRNKIKLVLLDTLSRFWNIGDENSNAEVAKRLKPLLALARNTNAAVVLIHHASKNGGEHGKGVRGGSAVLDIVDQALILERRPGGNSNHRTLKTLGRYNESPDELVIELKDGNWVSHGTSEENSPAADERKVLNVLSKEPLDVERLVRASGIGRKRVDKVLEALTLEGKVIKEGKGVRGDAHTYRLDP